MQMISFRKTSKVLARLVMGLLVLGSLGAACSARADTVRIVALGASNTNGAGVGAAEAWPAQLQGMLRAKGYDATVTVAAVNGDTSADILRRLDGAVTAGTKVVIYDLGLDNDHKKGLTAAQTAANKAQIVAGIRAHGAIPIQARYNSVAGEMHSAKGDYQAGGFHLTPHAHAHVAAVLLPQVIAALGKRK
jgi:acyl-CoA thioesterase-1